MKFALSKKTMKKFLILVLILSANLASAQLTKENILIDRKGFIIGLGVGAGVLDLKTNEATSVTFSTTIPNLKIGYMLNYKFALLAILPGSNYKYNGKDRGFEAFTLGGQYWVKEKWWILSATGLSFDAPAFYTVGDIQKAEFHTGLPALTAATGYEIWHRGRFALDLQYRIFFGQSNLYANGHRDGISNMFILGFNWY